jgi:hypothetical protein
MAGAMKKAPSRPAARPSSPGACPRSSTLRPSAHLAPDRPDRRPFLDLRPIRRADVHSTVPPSRPPMAAAPTPALIRSFVLRQAACRTPSSALDELGPVRRGPMPTVRRWTWPEFSADRRRTSWKSVSAWVRHGGDRPGHPENDYLGIEVHAPGVGALCKLIGELRARQPAHRPARRRRSACATCCRKPAWTAYTSSSPIRGRRSAITSAG